MAEGKIEEVRVTYCCQFVSRAKGTRLRNAEPDTSRRPVLGKPAASTLAQREEDSPEAEPRGYHLGQAIT